MGSPSHCVSCLDLNLSREGCPSTAVWIFSQSLIECWLLCFELEYLVIEVNWKVVIVQQPKFDSKWNLHLQHIPAGCSTPRLHYPTLPGTLPLSTNLKSDKYWDKDAVIVWKKMSGRFWLPLFRDEGVLEAWVCWHHVWDFQQRRILEAGRTWWQRQMLHRLSSKHVSEAQFIISKQIEDKTVCSVCI